MPGWVSPAWEGKQLMERITQNAQRSDLTLQQHFV